MLLQPRIAPPLQVAAAHAAKLNVTLYSESLCPDCIHFITGAWIDVFNTPGVGGADGIINFNQVVFGNAEVRPAVRAPKLSLPPSSVDALALHAVLWCGACRFSPTTRPSCASTARRSAP